MALLDETESKTLSSHPDAALINQKLTFDLLSLVFQATLEDDAGCTIFCPLPYCRECTPSRRNHIGRVCKLWRNVYLHTPALWTRIVIHLTPGFPSQKIRQSLTERVQEALEREESRITVKLGIALSSDASDDYNLDFLEPFMTRIDKLVTYFYKKRDRLTGKWLQAFAGNSMRELQLRLWEPLGISPISHYTFAQASPAQWPWPHLVSLDYTDLKVTLESVMWIISNVKSLEVLHGEVWNSRPPSMSSLSSHGPLVAPNLVEVGLYFFDSGVRDWFQHLTLPSLSSLSIQLSAAARDGYSLQDFLPFLRRSRCPLKKLIFRGPLTIYEEDVEEIMHILSPSIKHLHIPDSLFNDSVMQLMANDTLLRHLEHASFSMAITTSSVPFLSILLDSRATIRSAPARSLYLRVLTIAPFRGQNRRSPEPTAKKWIKDLQKKWARDMDVNICEEGGRVKGRGFDSLDFGPDMWNV